MRKFSLAIFGILSLLFVNAQEAAEPAEAAQEPAKEKQAVNQQKRLRDQTLTELDKKNQRAREAGDIAAKFKKSSAIQNPEIRITEYLRLQKRIAALQQEIQKANRRQADLAGELRAASLDTNISEQEADDIRECRQYIDEFAQAQRLMAMQLKKLSGNIQIAIFKLPPPSGYTTRSGLKMRLVGTGANAFYVSEDCIPAELFDAVRSAIALKYEPVIAGTYSNANASGSYSQAVAFCKWLSAYEFNAYSLPEMKHIRILPNYNALPQKAIWSATVWSPDDVNYSRAAERFGVKFQNVWDPQHLLSGEDFTGELPEASYKNLGFIVVSGIKTGIRQRLDKLIKVVNDEAQANEAKKEE